MPDRNAEDESRSIPARGNDVPKQRTLQEGEDYYYEGPYMVFTEQYHLKRGTCCHSGCRHCPYKEKD